MPGRICTNKRVTPTPKCLFPQLVSYLIFILALRGSHSAQVEGREALLLRRSGAGDAYPPATHNSVVLDSPPSWVGSSV